MFLNVFKCFVNVLYALLMCFNALSMFNMMQLTKIFAIELY